VTTFKPDTDKRARLIAQSDLFDGGLVRLQKHAPWLEEFVVSYSLFPAATMIRLTLSPKRLPGAGGRGAAGSEHTLP
jgi:hypothetical protein